VVFLRSFFFSALIFLVVCADGFSPAAAQTPDPQTGSQPAAKPDSKPTAVQPSATKPPVSKKKPAPATSAKPAKKPVHTASRRNTPRLRRMRQAFVASATLKPMARQLLQDRTPQAYAGVEAFARKHSAEDAGSLAWLAVGYARYLDHDYAQAIDPLNRAKPHAGDIGDYVAYYLAASYLASGRTPEAVAALSSFDETFPDSLLARDAHVLYASALLTDNRPKDAIALLEKDREPIRSDIELVLGRAYAAAGDPAKAVTVLRHLYFTLPLSPEAASAQSELQKLASTPGVSPPTFEDQRTRADLLAHAKKYSDAADAYRDLLRAAIPADKPFIQLALAEMLHHSNQDREAKQLLNSVQIAAPEIAAERLYDLGEMQRAADQDDAFLQTVADIRKASPTSPFLEQALLNAGNIYLLRKDYDNAIASYREIDQRFPTSPRAHYAHWKTAWLTFRQGRNAEAKALFEQQVAFYPDSNEAPAALYWRARLAEEDGDTALATAFYQKINDRFRNYYYGPSARQREDQLLAAADSAKADPEKNDPPSADRPSSDVPKSDAPSTDPTKNDPPKTDASRNDPPKANPPHYVILDRIPPLSTKPITDDFAPEDNLRVQKARLLENGGLLDFAVRELRAAAEEEKGSWLPAEIARMYIDVGRYDVAVETLKRAVPSYFAIDLAALPRSYWEALFPKPYWADLRKFSSANALDPYMVASLIRQESEFNPNAVSNKNALGLMQLLPSVGKGVAKQEKLKHFSTQQLFTPAVNLQLGTRYFRSMVDQFGGFEYALAAYDAGDDRVRDWQAAGKYRDIYEFVESIPFTETREYVQAIMRNANVYRQLYGAP
jgi:soluble lytic murein transglycosylase